MKKEIFDLLPKNNKEKETRERDIEKIEAFFKNNEELKKAIVFKEEGKYFISNINLKKIDCPIKRKNGKNYWEAFFILLGFEYSISPKSSGVILIVR